MIVTALIAAFGTSGVWWWKTTKKKNQLDINESELDILEARADTLKKLLALNEELGDKIVELQQDNLKLEQKLTKQGGMILDLTAMVTELKEEIELMRNRAA